MINLKGELLDANVYILEKGDSCIIIDSGASVEKVKASLNGKKPIAIFLTHGHFDHSIHCNDYAKAFNCKIYASEKIPMTLSDGVAIYSPDYSTIDDLSNFEYLKDGQSLKVGDFDVQCIAAPGHSLCCMCYLIDGDLFAGDVLFDKGIGRTDLKNSDKTAMLNTLKKLERQDFQNVFSGHGEKSNHDMQMKNITLFKRFLSR